MPDRSSAGDTLSRKLRELREAAGLRQVDVAKQAAISQSLIAKFENGRQVPRPDQTERLCRACNASAQDRRGLVALAEDLRAGDAARRFVMLIPEGSLGWALLPPIQMADQVGRIAAMSRRRNMRIGIISWGRISSVLPLHSWEIYDERAVITGSMTGTAVLTTRADVAAHLDLFATLERLAVYGEDAREILTRVADRYQELAGFCDS